jgi:hypothetical protein
MKQKCQACGVEKDSEVKEVYPYPDDGIIDDAPIQPFFTIDCQGPRVDGMTDWRAVTVCHDCFHKLDVDICISERCWQSLSPTTPFEQLPKLNAKPSA